MNDLVDDFFIPQAEPVIAPKEAPKEPQPLSPSLKIYMVAGEASGDLIGSHLMKELKTQLRHPILFYGVGGDRMEIEGLHSLFPFHELSLLGVVELLPYLMTIFSRINLVVDDVMNKRPDVLITIDSPGFTFRVVEKLRAAGYTGKILHYVAPTVWAYKPERAEYCAKLFDHMLVLMEFEKEYFDDAGLPCTWVGHPIVIETTRGTGSVFREKYEIPEETPLFCLLPGSRKSEVERHMPVFAKAIMMLAPYYPDLAMTVAVPRNMMEYIGPYFSNCPFRAVVTSNEDDKKNAIAASNIAFVKSGTVTLEVAMANVPMLIAYRIHPISAWYFKRKSMIRHVNLINIIQQQEVFPELLQDNCNALMVASVASELLANKDRQQFQRQQTTEALKQFIPPADQRPSDLACKVVISLLGLEHEQDSQS
jgi:lipid-A-disaccharide synthase